MRRLKSSEWIVARERGATTIVVALTMTLLLGFVGLALDVGASYAKKTELQTGADAAALAIAQQHAENDTDCYSGGDADEWVQGNVKTPGDETVGTHSCVSQYSVKVTASDVKEHWFLGFAGLDESAIDATATAEWGSPTSTTVVFPIAFSTCEFEAQVDTGIVEINFTKDSDTYGEIECEYSTDWPESGNNFPGGFGFLVGTDGDCTPNTVIGEWVQAKDGNSLGGETCSFPSLSFRALVPLFDDCKTGSPAASAACRRDAGLPNDENWYRISKFAAFEIVGYDFNAGYKAGQPCSNKPCIRGEFKEYVEVDPGVVIGDPIPDSAKIVRLID